MKKIYSLASLLLLSFFFRPFGALASNLKDAFSLSATSSGVAGYNTQSSLESTLSIAVTVVLTILGVVFIGLIIYSGIIWMTANGNEQKVEKASTTLKDSFIGLIVVMAAYAISFFLFSIFGGQLAK